MISHSEHYLELLGALVSTASNVGEAVDALLGFADGATHSDRVLSLVGYTQRLEVAGMKGSLSQTSVVAKAVNSAQVFESGLTVKANALLRLRLVAYTLSRLAATPYDECALAAKEIRDMCAV